jgi:predicted ATPase/DNA-binding winged helix-turn-helix (wHTH) protein
MVEEEQHSHGKTVSFGPFRLFGAERRLERDGRHLKVGGRALEILIALVERAEDVVTKRELADKVWPGQIVDESCLRFHIRALRQVLGDDGTDARYIATIAGRGYCFVAPRGEVAKRLANQDTRPANHAKSLPGRLMRMVGRDEAVQGISAQLIRQRFVSIVGPAGVGKTTVAVALAHAMAAHFSGAVHFVDFGPLRDPRQVPATVASAFGLLLDPGGMIAPLLDHLQNRKALLVLDCCEHLIEGVASLAEALFQAAPLIHILATSRESLRAEGERVHRLLPLGCPPENPNLTAADTLSFPAVQLFVDRMKAGGFDRQIDDADAPVLAEICRRLDGIALALELAAGRINVHGIRGTADLLDSQFKLLWQGRRTAISRHQTLCAALDWSYNLLSETERVVLRRLCMFVGFFSLDAAKAVAAGGDITPDDVTIGIENLVAKSLAISDTGNANTRYRLLDMMRAYLRKVLTESGEACDVARRHASHYSRTLREINVADLALSGAAGAASFGEHLKNARAALNWSFSASGNPSIGVALVCAVAPILLGLSLLTECRKWAEWALAALTSDADRQEHELELLTAFAVASTFTQGSTPEVLAAFGRGLQIAETRDDWRSQVRLLGVLNIFLTRSGDFEAAFAVSLRYQEIAEACSDPAATTMASLILGSSHHFKGDQLTAVARCEVSCHLISDRRSHLVQFDYDHRIRARIALARAHWLRGHLRQAIEIAKQTLVAARALGHAVVLCMTEMFTVSILLWAGEYSWARRIVDHSLVQAEEHALAPYRAIALGFRGELALHNGEQEAGIQLLRQSLGELEGIQHRVLVPTFASTLAENLASTGRQAEALLIMEAVIAHENHHGTSFFTPEIWRIEGDILRSMGTPRYGDAESCLTRSLEWSRRQSAIVWELRAAMSLARFRHAQGRTGEGRRDLNTAYRQFTEGLEAPDLRSARRLLDQLERGRARPADCRRAG